jgi:translation initiation factor 3 subunit B
MLDMKDAVMALAWEPRGSRFAMIHAENPSSTKVNVSFYDMKKVVETTVPGRTTKKGNPKVERSEVSELNHVETLEGKQCNALFWSPAGQTIILASLGDSASGTLEFYDVDSRSLTIKEHYRANQVVWDPSGRTVATTVTQPIGGGHFKFAMDNVGLVLMRIALLRVWRMLTTLCVLSLVVAGLCSLELSRQATIPAIF